MGLLQYVPGHYAPGCVIAVPVTTSVGIVSHKGILSDRVGGEHGLPMVIHNTKLLGTVVESTMEDYVLTGVGPVISEGYPGKLPPALVIARARALIGHPWRPWDNCEHFAHYAHGLPKKSPQMRAAAKKTVGAAGVAAFCWFAFKFAP